MSREEREAWEHDAFELLSQADEDGGPPGVDERLTERSLERVKEYMTARDAVEFGTGVLIEGFLGPVLDLFAHALGLDRSVDRDAPETKQGES